MSPAETRDQSNSVQLNSPQSTSIHLAICNDPHPPLTISKGAERISPSRVRSLVKFKFRLGRCRYVAYQRIQGIHGIQGIQGIHAFRCGPRPASTLTANITSAYTRAVCCFRSLPFKSIYLLQLLNCEVSMRIFQKLTIAAIVAAVPASVFADYSYQQTTQITGGSMMAMMKMAGAFSSQARKAEEPITSSIYIKGNRMANVAPDRIEIIDLDAETIANVDTTKRTYTVMTFQQIRDQLAQAQ